MHFFLVVALMLLCAKQCISKHQSFSSPFKLSGVKLIVRYLWKARNECGQPFLVHFSTFPVREGASCALC